MKMGASTVQASFFSFTSASLTPVECEDRIKRSDAGNVCKPAASSSTVYRSQRAERASYASSLALAGARDLNPSNTVSPDLFAVSSTPAMGSFVVYIDAPARCPRSISDQAQPRTISGRLFGEEAYWSPRTKRCFSWCA